MKNTCNNCIHEDNPCAICTDNSDMFYPKPSLLSDKDKLIDALEATGIKYNSTGNEAISCISLNVNKLCFDSDGNYII